MPDQPTLDSAAVIDQKRRLQWFVDARLGMFIHYGLYSQLGRGEWVMNRERIPVKEYERLAATFCPKPGAPDAWARLAVKSGMKYMVMTAKHHEGFCLWDTRQTDYNAVKRGPGRDIVAEYIDACRRHGLRVGLYYSLMDWHHPDGLRCATDQRARRRFLDFTQACVRELTHNYGKIDILWYDIPLPLDNAERWESARMNAIAREKQPDLLINARSYLPEDFDQSEGGVRPSAEGRAWECCTTTASGWGYMPTPPDEWLSARRMVRMLRDVIAGSGNFLLNIGPEPDGSIPPEGAKQFSNFGKWVAAYAEVVYGRSDRVGAMEGTFCGDWTRRGNTGYYWLMTWTGDETAVGGIVPKVKRVCLLPENKPLKFRQEKDRVTVFGLPKRCPDSLCEIGVIKYEFDGEPVQRLGPCMKPI
jgi:alpha-L-fucosidase